ncbi:MAG: protein kinase [Verrucomicrobia bacterium]|nr:protein kinase [Verrucomicrobiota bacterium]
MSDQPNTDPQDAATAGSAPLSGAPPHRTTGGSMRWTPPSPEHLQRMLPQYEVLAIVGHGGMGAVYQAKQISLDRLVAIKILPPEAADDEQQFIQRFKNEARTMAKMLHPAIVAVFDFGETSEGQLYFVMEYVDGTDVAQMIKDQGKLLPEHALAITAHVCDALRYAHEHGIIHRDIKPANILLNKEGAVKVADFGLAKMNDLSLTVGLTQSGKTMGTPDFVAPEALTLGMVADHRADLYAIGVMLYQMLTGKIPRGAYKAPSQLVPGLDARFDAIVLRAMQEDREDRYQSAQEIRSALDVILTTPELKVETPPPPRKPVARGPQPGHKSTPVVAQTAVAQTAPPTDGKSADVPKKLPVVPIGIGAAAMLGIGAFFLFKSPKPEPKPVVPTQEASKPAPKPEIVQSTPPKVSSPSTKSSTPTKPVMPAPVVASAPLTGPVNLLAQVEVQRDVLEGGWKMTSDGLMADGGFKSKTLIFRQRTPAEYDFEIEFTIDKGWGRCAMVLPLPQKTIRWQMGSEDPTLSAFGPNFDGQKPESLGRTEAVARLPKLDAKRRYRCLVEVRKDSLRALLDGEEVLKWSGDFNRLSNENPIINQADPNCPGLSTYATSLTFHKAELRPPSATLKPADKPITTTPVITSAPLTGPVNLLALVDVPRDAVKGEWKMTPEGLEASSGDSETLLFQRSAPEEYDYEIEFTITGGSYQRCNMIFPLSHGSITWQMGTKNEASTQFFFGPKFNGRPTEASEQADALRLHPRLKFNERYRCLVEVRKDSLRALLDGEEVLKWSGDLKRFSGIDRILNGRPDQKRLGVFSNKTPLTFHKAELRPPFAAAKPADKPITAAPIAVAPIAVAPKVPDVAPTPVAVAPTIPTPAPPTTPVGDPRLAQLEAGFKARYETDAQKPFEAAVATLKQSYATNGIPRARAAAQAKGSLADVTALDAEKAAMENGSGVPTEDAADTPDSLKALRNTYRSALAKITADRTAKAIPLYNLYLGALDVYTTELTKANKLDDARRVKALRDDLATKKPEAVTAAAPSPKAEPPKPFTSSGPIKTPEVKPATGSYWRAAAKWLVANGGTGRIIVDGNESDLKTLNDLPPGKFGIVELHFDRLNNSAVSSPSDEDFQVFNGQKDLRKVNVRSTPGLTDAAFAFLAGNKELTLFHTEGVENIGDGIFVHLSGLKKITTLDIEHSQKLTGKGMDKLACLPVLTKVDLINCTALTDDALKALGNCKKLIYVRVSGVAVTDAGLADLASATSLQTLYLENCKKITDKGFASLRSLKSLNGLVLNRTNFDDAGVSAIAELKSLENLSLQRTQITDAGLAKLTTLTSLKKVGIRETKVTDAGIAAFKKALPNCEVEK